MTVQRDLPPKPPDDKTGNPSSGRRVRQDANPLLMMGAGVELAGVVLVMAIGGWWLDGKLGTGPWMMVAGVGVGMVGGIYNLYRIGKRFF